MPQNPLAPQLSPVSFLPATGTIFFVPAFFEGRLGRNVKWRPTTVEGAVIQIGTILGDIFWNDGTVDHIVSPVAGTIVSINAMINNANLGIDVQEALTVH